MELVLKLRIILLVTLTLPVDSETIANRKAIRREMVELDVAVRNLTSIIATSDKKMLDDTLERLVNWQIKDHPDHGKPFREVLGHWESSGALKFGKSIHAEANAMRNYANGRGKFNNADWDRVKLGFSKILTACQGCHDLTNKETK